MSDEVNETVDREEWHDRLIDRGLREVVSGEKPPELAARILAAAGTMSAADVPAIEPVPVNSAAPPSRGGIGWIQFAVAASLLVGAGTMMLFTRVNGLRGPQFAAGTRGVTPAAAPALPSIEAEDFTQQDLRYVGRPGGSTGVERGAMDNVAELLKRQKLRSDQQAIVDGLAVVDGETQRGLSTLAATPLADETRYTFDALADAPADAGTEPFGSGRRLREYGIAPEASTTDFYAVIPGQGGAQGGGQQRGGESGQPVAGGSQLEVSAGSGLWAWSDPKAIEDAVQLQPDRRYAQIAGNGVIRSWSSEATGQGQQASSGEALALPGDDATVGIPFREGAIVNESRAANADFDQLDSDGLAMLVTPHIIIEEEEEQRLGVPLDEQQLGRGAQAGGDQYARIVDNPFHAISAATTDNRLSTFSIDVDTASYANVRQFLMDSNTLPPPDAVRIEELVNYFDYDYSAPTGDVPFASNVEVAACPWEPEHRLVRVGIKGREMERTARPKSNLVFLVDVSGSMDEPNKLPLVVEGLRMLTRELGENDRIAIVVYASSEGLVLESTRGDQQQVILDALNRLSAGGSTAGGAGIVLAYKLAEQNFIKDGVNRVILCTDGDFNVGVTSTGDLQRLAEEKAKNTGVFLTVLGFGRGNLNDAMMEAIADHGNGNYHYVDNRTEARKVLVEEMTGTLVTIAKDVKIQIEFNPAAVAGYRLIGYENRVLAAEDFNDDKKDAGEIGAGHTVTALYEIVPAGQKVDATSVDALKYAPVATEGGDVEPAGGGDAELAGGGDAELAGGGDAPARNDGELLTLKIRYKKPDGDVSTKLEFPVTDNGQTFSEATADFQFASAVAGFGMLLRGSPHKGDASFAGMLEIAESASRDSDERGYRGEFCEMIRRAKELSGY